ncbi:thiamine pyrophosphate-dependent enzyme [Frigidibacter sp. MR17.24]|uniref:thiamine pyrophosphate-dependent enzyme n=1 Tax=Frigidibacter sp. MR17.24 TaxID=3127345 RepID=UPI003012C68D
MAMVAKDGRLHRRAVVAALLEDRGGLAVVSGLGAPAWDLAAAGDHALSLPLWGAMGGAAMVGLGLALAQPGRPVMVLTGDGEMMMGLGALATIAVAAPANLSVVVLDNGVYGETGMQPAHSSAGVDLVQIARGCGFSRLAEPTDPAGIAALRAQVHACAGPLFARVAIDPEKLPLVLPPEAIVLKNRFREAVMGRDALYA